MRKIAKSCLLILFTALAIVGTKAYYTTTLTSNENKITSAKFIVTADGILDANAEFKLNAFAPGKSTLYDFTIDKTNTEVPVVYNINFTKSGELLDTSTPIKFQLVKFENSTDESSSYTPINSGSTDNTYVIYPQSDTEKYGIKIDWPWDASDEDTTKYSGKTGSVIIGVKATQLAADPVSPPDTQNVKAAKSTVIITDRNYTTDNHDNYTSKDTDREIVFNQSLRTIKISNTKIFGDAIFSIDGQLIDGKYTKGKLIYCSKDVGYDNAGTFVHYSNTEGWDIKKDGNIIYFSKNIGKSITIDVQSTDPSISSWE